jgi:hypothetical protein
MVSSKLPRNADYQEMSLSTSNNPSFYYLYPYHGMSLVDIIRSPNFRLDESVLLETPTLALPESPKLLDIDVEPASGKSYRTV